MDMDDEESVRKAYEHYSDTRLEAEIAAVGEGYPTSQIIKKILAERRALPQKQFEKTYAQSERHHRTARIAAVISIIGALAAWASVWFQSVQTRIALDEFRQHPVAAITPPPSLSSQ